MAKQVCSAGDRDKRSCNFIIISEIFYLIIFFGLWGEFHLFYKFDALRSEVAFLLIVAAPFIYFLAFHIYYIFVSFKEEQLKYLRKTAILLFLFRILLLFFVFANWMGATIVLDAIIRSGWQTKKEQVLFNNVVWGSIEIIPYVIFEIFFTASFFVKKLKNKKKVIIAIFFLSLVCVYALEGSFWEKYTNRKATFIFSDKNGLYGLLDENGNEVAPAKHTQIEVLGNGRIALFAKDGIRLINEKGRIISSTFYEIGSFNPVDSADPDAGMLAPASLGPNEYGFIDESGNFKIDPIFESVRSFHNGFAPVKISGKWGLIDKNGKIALNAIYDSIWIMQNGLLIVTDEKTSKKCVIKTDGTEIFSCEYDKIQAFNKLLYAYKKDEDKSLIFDLEGKLLFETEGSGTLWDLREDMTSFKTKEETLIFDTANKIVLRLDSSFKINGFFYKGRIEVKTPEKQEKYFDIKGKELPDSDDDKDEKFITWHIFRKSGKAGIEDSNGEIIIPAKYDEISAPFPIQTTDKIFIVGNNDLYGVINKAGKEIFPIEFDYIDYFYDGEAIASKNGKYMVLEESGKVRFVSEYPIKYLVKKVIQEFPPKKERWIP